jgi:hypothetical protein
MPGKPEAIVTKPLVSGTCTLPSTGFTVELRPHTPASPDPKILVLDAIVHAPTIPIRYGRTDVPVRYGSPYVHPKTGTLYDNGMTGAFVKVFAQGGSRWLSDAVLGPNLNGPTFLTFGQDKRSLGDLEDAADVW